MSKSSLKMSGPELEQFLHSHFPEIDSFEIKVEKLEPEFLQIRLLFHARHLRPGGTISGPTMMTLADTAMYLAVLSHIGPVALTVTTSLNINFLRKPAQKDVIAQTRLLKLGARLAVGDVLIFSDGETAPVAQATVTYSIPPR